MATGVSAFLLETVSGSHYPLDKMAVLVHKNGKTITASDFFAESSRFFHNSVI